ncbi:hypothetical protein N9985_02915 [Gammaproteobacteria bacterium]|nr:hypothetical protein [Gammaproteobacteria bacterium]
MNRDIKGKALSATECLKHARMLVPKFSFEHDGEWHIQWPKDLPHVVHAKSEKDLVPKLATWLQEIGRVANRGKHVDPEYP